MTSQPSAEGANAAATQHELVTIPVPTAPLSPATQATYRRDWELFTDWCQAYEHTPLPASPAAVQAFLAEVPIAASRRRCAAAIAWAHRAAGQPAPIVAAPRSPDPALLAVDTGRLLSRIPLWGWPAGMFGRRDAMLVILRFDAALTLPAIATLGADRIRVADRQLTIDGDRDAVTLPPAADTRHCPACVWLRWRALLLRIRRHHTAAMLRQALGVNAVHDDPRPAGHRCTTPAAASTLDGPVLLPINQWGATPLPRRPPTPRALSGLAAAHWSGFPPHHRADTEPVNDHHPGEPATDQAPTPAVTEYREPYELVHQRGLAARRQAIATLQSARADIDQVDRQVDELQDRIDALTSTALDLRDRIPARPGGAPRSGG